MKKFKLLILSGTLFVFSCQKESVKPQLPVAYKSQSATDSLIVNDNTDTTSEQNYLFESNYNDSLHYSTNTIDANNYLISDNGFTIRISGVEPDSIKAGTYTNEYLVSNVDYGLRLIHSVYLGDGSLGGIELGSSATQINTLEVTQVRNDSVWITYDVDWYYTHWQDTQKNANGNIKAQLNGFKYR